MPRTRTLTDLRTKGLLPIVALLLALDARALAGSDFVNFETQQGEPIAVSNDGTRVFAVNTPDNRLVVFDSSSLARLAEIRVGLEPTSVLARPGSDEIWVVNDLSDSVSIVSASARAVVATIGVGDEPIALVFTPDGARAYVTVSRQNVVAVIDAVSRSVLKTIPIDGEDPRSIAISPDGSKVYVLPFESGNQTRGARPTDTTAKATIVLDSSLPDHDLFEIGAGADAVTRTVDHLGTLMTSVRTNPSGTRLYAAHTDARNLVFGEENLRGVAVDSRLTILDAATLGVLHQIELDAIGSRTAPNAQPLDIAFNADGSKVYVAAFGGDAVSVFDSDGRPSGRIPVGRGPRGLAFDPANGRLFVLSRINQSITAIDTTVDHVAGTAALGYDPTPPNVRDGRRFLYSAKLSGSGKMSCASCHAGGHFDNLVWDLGTAEDPKGPMFTLSLRGLVNQSPYHWRGEKPDLLSFNPAFDTLLGGHQLSAANMQIYADFMNSIVYPPNPREALDRSLSGSVASGYVVYNTPGTVQAGGSCASCHSLETPAGAPAYGTDRQVFAAPDRPGVQMKVPQLRGLIEKSAYTHDGVRPTLDALLSQPVFRLTAQQRGDLIAYLDQFESETMPATGVQRTLDAATCSDGEALATIQLLMDRATHEIISGTGTPEIEVEATGLFPISSGGRRSASLLYRPDLTPPAFQTDLTGDGPYSFDQLQTLACQGLAVLTFTGIPTGTGVRTLDRDEDGLPDGDESQIYHTDPGNPDTDGDGLRDASEVLVYHTDPLLADSDGDGVYDAQEIVDGTNPLDPISAIKLVSVSPQDLGSAATLTWTTQFGAEYVVEAADVPAVPSAASDLGWTTMYSSPVPENESPTGTESYTDGTAPPAGSVRFYRVRIAPAP